MKKVALLGLIIILLAVSVVPVMAAGPNNGHGNGGNSGQGNSAGDQTKQQNKDKTRLQDQENKTNRGMGRNGSHGRTRTPFYLQGTISATTGNTITVTLIHGNSQVKPFFSTGLTVQVTGSTRIFQLTQGGEGEATGESGAPTTGEDLSITNSDDEKPGNKVPITFEQLIGLGKQKVAIHGNVVAGVFIATKITVYIQTPPVPPG